MKSLVIKTIQTYKAISRLIWTYRPAVLVYSPCNFSPTCSEYTQEAVNKHGVLKGLFKGFKRLMRCNPFNKGGFDPVN